MGYRKIVCRVQWSPVLKYSHLNDNINLRAKEDLKAPTASPSGGAKGGPLQEGDPRNGRNERFVAILWKQRM